MLLGIKKTKNLKLKYEIRAIIYNQNNFMQVFYETL